MSFHLLLLPLEVRRLIYRYALPHSIDKGSFEAEGVPIDPELYGSTRTNYSYPTITIDPCAVRWFKGIAPSILFASRQVHEEACEILYQENTFPIYAKHPRQPRLPMNDNRADDDSFVHISWSHRSWFHPRNPKIPLVVLRNHSHLSQIRKLHVDLPEMCDLLAADMYMRSTSYASHYGLCAWVEKLGTNGGSLSDADRERLNYVKRIKAPIDEIAQILRTLPRIDHLSIFFKSEKYEVAFIEYVTSSLLGLRGIKRAHCVYNWSTGRAQLRDSFPVELREYMMAPRMHRLERDLESLLAPKSDPQAMGLSVEANQMLMLLEAVRDRMLLVREMRSKFQDSRVDAALPILTNIMRE